MEGTESVAAPAQDSPVAATAVDQAVVSRDAGAFLAARRAEREGKPLEAAAVPERDDPDAGSPETTIDPSKERTLSKRQQQINTYERTIAQQRAEIARLSAATPATPAPVKESPAPAPEKFMRWDEYARQHPDHSHDDYLDARDGWSREQAQTSAQQQKETDARVTSHRATVEGFQSRIEKHVETHPEFLEQVHPWLLDNLVPTAQVPQGQPRTVHNVMADRILASELAPALLQHFTDHPDDYRRLAASPTPEAFFIAFGKCEAALEQKAAAVTTPNPKPVSRMPAVTQLGTRGTETADEEMAAVSSRDPGRFLRVQRERRIADLAGRR